MAAELPRRQRRLRARTPAAPPGGQPSLRTGPTMRPYRRHKVAPLPCRSPNGRRAAGEGRAPSRPASIGVAAGSCRSDECGAAKLQQMLGRQNARGSRSHAGQRPHRARDRRLRKGVGFVSSRVWIFVSPLSQEHTRSGLRLGVMLDCFEKLTRQYVFQHHNATFVPLSSSRYALANLLCCRFSALRAESPAA